MKIRKLLTELGEWSTKIEHRLKKTRYVYQYTVDGEIVYVGVGNNGANQNLWARALQLEAHPTIAKFHKKTGKRVKVHIVHIELNFWEALGAERALIAQHQPRFNLNKKSQVTAYVGSFDRGSARRSAKVYVTEPNTRLSRLLMESRAARKKAKLDERIKKYGSLEAYKKKRQQEANLKWLSDPINKELQRLRNNLNYHRKAGNTERVKELEKEMNVLVEKRNEG